MATSVVADSVVSIHYTLTLEDKEVVDSSRGSDPLDYLHGHGNIVVGLETALNGKKIGDKVQVTVKPDDGYGEYNNDLTIQVEKKHFPKDAALDIGQVFEFSNSQGVPVMVRVTGVAGEVVTVDANHPLAGKTLHFDVEVMGIRPATKEEIEHGHAHSGSHGHHH